MPSYLDLAVLGVVLVSALLSMMRGFTREVLAIASWAAAAAAAYYFYPLVMPYLAPYIHKEVVAQAVAAAIVFFVTLIIVSLFTVRLSDAILDSKIGALDRSLGFVFGVARGFLAGGGRLRDLQLAGRREAAAGMGQERQDAADPDRDRRPDHRHAARGRRDDDRRLDQVAASAATNELAPPAADDRPRRTPRRPAIAVATAPLRRPEEDRLDRRRAVRRRQAEARRPDQQERAASGAFAPAPKQ